MTFEEILDQAMAMLQRRGRVTYQTLKLQFQLDEEHLEALKDAILYTYPQVHNDAGRGLVWMHIPPAVAAEAAGRFDAVLAAVTALLRCEGRVTYRLLRLACGLDAALLEAVCRELTFKQLAYDAHGEGLVWTGEPFAVLPPVAPAVQQPALPDAAGLSTAQSLASSAHVPAPALAFDVQDDGRVPAPTRSAPEAERRQLTVLFCDLVGSTQLSGQLDPEDLRAVVRAYQEAAAEVIQHYAGHIAQYLGDGLLVYFGYPTAHEDDARRAVHTGLGIVEAMGTLNSRLQAAYGVALAVRLGIHTGPVVVGVMGGGARHEHLALGETPNIAARLEALAAPNTVMISAVTAQLVQRAFVLEALGPQALRGIIAPIEVWRVVSPLETLREATTVAPEDVKPLVGRSEELGLLLRRWEQSTAGQGQVVLIRGEAGIGKSALVETLRTHVRREELMRVAIRCSPYHTNSALYPIIAHVQLAVRLARDDTTEEKLTKLERALQPLSLPPVQEHSTEGLVQIRQGLDLYRSTEAEAQRPHFLTLLAEASGLLGQPEDGLAALDEALTLVEKTGERYYEAELHRQRGELLLLRAAKSHPAQDSRKHREAETCFQHALDVARQQQAMSLELRAAMSLARLWQRQGKRVEARALLEEIYGWFTEGFDTADLQEARALLEVLA